MIGTGVDEDLGLALRGVIASLRSRGRVLRGGELPAPSFGMAANCMAQGKDCAQLSWMRDGSKQMKRHA